MRGRRAEQIEACADHLAALTLAGAAGFCAGQLADGQLSGAPQIALALALTSLLYTFVFRALRNIEAVRHSFKVHAFRLTDPDFADLGELLLTEQVELVLTDADRLEAPPTGQCGELLLDDRITPVASDSRVVQLFDPAAYRTPGQLNDRILAHWRAADNRSARAPRAVDASEALHQALNELRRSLR